MSAFSPQQQQHHFSQQQHQQHQQYHHQQQHHQHHQLPHHQHQHQHQHHQPQQPHHQPPHHQSHPVAPPSPQEMPYTSFSSKYATSQQQQQQQQQHPHGMANNHGQPFGSERRFHYIGSGMESLLNAIEVNSVEGPPIHLPTPGTFAPKMNTLPPISTYNLPLHPPSPPLASSPSSPQHHHQHHSHQQQQQQQQQHHHHHHQQHQYERRSSGSLPPLSLPLPMSTPTQTQTSSSGAMSISSLLDTSAPAPISPKEPPLSLTAAEYSIASILVNPSSYSPSATRSTAFTPYNSHGSNNNGGGGGHQYKRKWSDSYNYEEERANKIRRSIRDQLGQAYSVSSPMINDLPSPQQSPRPSPPPSSQMTTITCYHAAVAQKSYGSEKRFLCPPPVITMTGPAPSADRYSSERPQVAMSVVCETGDRSIEQKSSLDDNMKGSFKYLHVTGTAKAKQFHLKLKIFAAGKQNMPFALFESNPISIISKPSKKTAKARNVSSCILSNSPVSLFNRINSQTVRTKYMSVEGGQLCAKNSSWSSFTILVVNRGSSASVSSPSPSSPSSPSSLDSSSWTDGSVSPAPSTSSSTSSMSLSTSTSTPVSSASAPITYGTEIILTDTETGISSDILVIRKVEKGSIAQGACGPVSQMQKVALQRVARDSSDASTYLSAAGTTSDATDRAGSDSSSSSPTSSSSSSSSSSATSAATVNSNAILGYQPSRLVHKSSSISSNGDGGDDAMSGDTIEEVEDYLCWTIVGINKFEYTYFEALSSSSGSSSPSSAFQPPTSYPITPFPTLTTIPAYKQSTHTLDLTVSNFFSDAHQQQPMEIWLGHHGPLKNRLVRRSTPIAPSSSSPGATMQLKSSGSSSYASYEASSLVVELPSTQDVISCNHDLLFPSGLNGRALELPILFVRQDGVAYHSGKACNVYVDSHGGENGKWSVKNVN